ncbi:hypothetical protein I3W98_39965, partial [Streptomyces cavourensis]|nr:hypothetical protein [Streptomyces cavourensis]
GFPTASYAVVEFPGSWKSAVVDLEGQDGTSRSGTCASASVVFGAPENASTRTPDPAGATPP